MKKAIVLFLAASIVITALFAGCSKKPDENGEKTTKDNNLVADGGLSDAEQEFGFETDENGKEVAVVYEKDKDGNTIAVVLDKDGEKKKDDKGELVTVDTTYKISDTTKPAQSNTNKLTTTTAPAPTATTKKNIPVTENAGTTRFQGTENVPKLSATGKEVSFNAIDQETVSSMLEVPYLYLSNYENTDGVPIDIACHTAVWMAEREGATEGGFPSGPIVLNLFRFYGQTVVNFKTQCNQVAKECNAPIEYNNADGTFKISQYTSKKQTVIITRIEDLGDNNFYKITGDVSNCEKSKVVAIVQKNNLDRSLGFSIKALKWS